MAMKRMAIEIGMGTDIRGADYTKAAVRAVRDALWHNSLSVANALGKPTDDMLCEILVGVPKPEQVDKAAVLAVLPHGTGTVTVVQGGLEIVNDAGTGSTVMASPELGGSSGVLRWYVVASPPVSFPFSPATSRTSFAQLSPAFGS